MTDPCPVCGYPDLSSSWDDGADFAVEACPQCGFEFGVGKDDDLAFADWRWRWIAVGMPFRSQTLHAPLNWDPRRSLNVMLEQKYPTPVGPFVCPVCGYPELTEPPRTEGGGGSYEICWSCGFEFGVSDDDLGYTYEDWRARWIERGMPWDSADIRPAPPGWDPGRQLAAICGDN